MTYLKVIWLHHHENEPVELLSELDDSRMEVRKVERFRNGTLAFAGPAVAVGPARLGEAKVPTLEEIASDPQFQPSEIDPDTFERAWRTATLAAAA
jgi:hypothetical protein